MHHAKHVLSMACLFSVRQEPVKQSSKILALQAAEIARRQEVRAADTATACGTRV
jgi:hypothetical protein